MEKDKLWSQVLCAKYCKNRCDIDMFEKRADTSNKWCGILETVKHLKEGVRAEVGNGKKTVFWYHNWLDTTPLCKHTIQDIPSHIEDYAVDVRCGMLTQGGNRAYLLIFTK